MLRLQYGDGRMVEVTYHAPTGCYVQRTVGTDGAETWAWHGHGLHRGPFSDFGAMQEDMRVAALAAGSA